MPASWNERTIALNSDTAAPGFSADDYPGCGARKPNVL